MGAGAPNRPPMGDNQGPNSSMSGSPTMPLPPGDMNGGAPQARPPWGQSPGGQSPGQMSYWAQGQRPMPQNQSFQDMIAQMRPQRPMGMQRPPMQGMANQVAQQGRFGDSTLVHMNPAELRGLAALHPQGRLPTNPQTGYPEAFDLFGALSGLAGGGLGFLVGGPFGAAIGSGLATTAYSGDIGKGIISGLLGFGLGQAGSILGGLGSSAGEVTSEAAKEALKNSASMAAGATAAETASPFATGAASPITQQAVEQGIQAIPSGVTQAATQGGTQAALNVPAQPGGQSPGFFDKIGTGVQNRLDALGRIPQNISNNPGILGDAFVSNGLKTTVPIGLGLYGASLNDQSAAPAPPPGQPYAPSSNRPHPGRAFTPPPAGYRPSITGGPEWNWFANNYKDGGRIDTKDDRPSYQEEINKARRIPLWQAERELQQYQQQGGPSLASPNPFMRGTPPEVRFARGGYVPTPAISTMTMGRRISGPGGGLDDAIPALINGREPAHLSSGEHVIPAAAVSALGNGSSEDGHRQIERSIDNVMMRKFGTKNRNPRPIKAGSFLR